MGILSYNTTLGLRASQIEDILKNMLDEPTVQWEATAGIFRTSSEDILTTKVGRYWVMISLFVILAGVAPIVISLLYEYKEFRNSASNLVLVWTIIGFNLVMASVTIYIAFSFFYKRGWEKLKLPF